MDLETLRDLSRRNQRMNTMSFPQGLRDAIPEMKPCWGRALKLDAVDAVPLNTVPFGPQVQVKFTVCETGKLSGRFDVLAALDPDAARALAGVLLELADQAEKLDPAPWA